MPMDSLARALALKFIKGKADLVGGKIPASQLPSYVSEIIEVETYNDLPQPGQANVIYVVKTPSVVTYRWTGSTYIAVDEKAQYYSIKVDSNNVVTMGDLRSYVNNVISTGLHCFFDFSDFIINANTCTVLCFTQNAVNYCVIFDIINGRTYVDYSGYQDSETVQAYVNRLGDDIPRVISITDSNTKVQDIVDLLNDVNVIGHHILFDFHTIQANCYLCSVTYSSNNVVITDIVGCKVARATFDASTLLSTVLSGMGDVATLSGDNNFTGTLQKNSVDVATITQIIGKYFPFMDAPSSTTLTDEQKAQILSGCCVKGVFLTLNNPLFFPASGGFGGNRTMGFVIGNQGASFYFSAYAFNQNSNVIYVYQTLFEYVQGYGRINFPTNRLSIGNRDVPSNPPATGSYIYKFINDHFVWENEIPTSVSISDGGTISDTTLQGLITRHQPIVLNGFTCYFSCDDGTNYQYVSTRYDSSANKNHINVITINKSTWVVTFHTSDLALS